ncbi:SDR family oxidoreductase [Providencia burhodogranariea]|uniref:Short-chain dehydrogenase n=1 Tax=Providencia burhodogranariea DSM 19968 TaxID=1141662 RepID=K8WYS8_9GAMM|nr:SDR family oxidoreductase [Providencia burhodogranariea]EKT65056.1 short-chain dehydrogenase [Providencia burhodogranariea DSM 19968]
MPKTVLITGSSSGVGEATAKLFAEQGFNVIATMRAPEKNNRLDGIANLIKTKLDVEDIHSIESAIFEGIDAFGKIDLVINNAGFGQYGVFEGIPIEKIRKNFDVNLFGVMNVMQQIVPIFRQQGGGIILNVSSCGGIIGLPLISIYASTKFALEGFLESVSYELASQNIVTKIYEPGGIISPFHERSAHENTGTNGITSYDTFADNVNNAMQKMGQGAATVEQVAQDIYLAATDGTDRLRYCAPYGVENLVKARRELGNDAYEKYARTQLPTK